MTRPVDVHDDPRYGTHPPYRYGIWSSIGPLKTAGIEELAMFQHGVVPHEDKQGGPVYEGFTTIEDAMNAAENLGRMSPLEFTVVTLVKGETRDVMGRRIRGFVLPDRIVVRIPRHPKPPEASFLRGRDDDDVDWTTPYTEEEFKRFNRRPAGAASVIRSRRKRWGRTRASKPAFELLDDVTVNPVAQRAGGSRLWEATYFAAIEEGLTPEQAEQVTNSKFLRKIDPSDLVPPLSKTMQPFVRRHLVHTDAWNTVPKFKPRQGPRRGCRTKQDPSGEPPHPTLGTRMIGGERFEPVWGQWNLKGVRGIEWIEVPQHLVADIDESTANFANAKRRMSLRMDMRGEIRTTKTEAVRRAREIRGAGFKSRVVQVGGGRWMALKGGARVVIHPRASRMVAE